MKTAYYNLVYRPATWDFLSFAILAKWDGCEHIEIIPGLRKQWEHYRFDEVERRVDTIMIPLAKALGMTAQYVPVQSSKDSPYHHSIESVLPFLPLPFTIQGKGFFTLPPNSITITIREQSFQPLRNSNIGEWIEAARKLEDEGYRVIFISDHEASGRTYAEFGFFSEVPVDERIDIYRTAFLNFFIPNGPIILPMYFPIPAIVMHPVYREYKNTSEKFWHRLGVDIGKQPPWWTKERFFSWDPDNCESIMKAFHQWKELNMEAPCPQ